MGAHGALLCPTEVGAVGKHTSQRFAWVQVAAEESSGPERWEDVARDANWQEKALLVGVSSAAEQARSGYLIGESLNELERLANSAGLQVISCLVVLG